MKNRNDALILAQLIYWIPRGTINRQDGLWVAKNYKEWEKELTIDDRTARRSIERLVKMGIVIKDDDMFNGKRTLHLTINWDNFEELIAPLVDKRDHALDGERPDVPPD